jgi:hypothetical protein
MVLCPLHHDQATKGAMPEVEQKELQANPLNIVRGRARGPLEVKQDYCAADFGTLTVVGEGPFIRIDGEDILSLDMGPKNLELSLRLYGEDGTLLIRIERNEWRSGDPIPWDIEADWQTLLLRQKARKISIALDAKKIPMQILGEFWHSKRKVTIDRERILVHGNVCFGLANLALVGGGLDISTE